MATPRESNQEPRQGEVSQQDTGNTGIGPGAADAQAPRVSYARFSDEDPFRTDRINQTVSEARTILSEVRAQPAGFEDLDAEALESLYKDAEERALWSEPRSDAFKGILRMALRTPPRARRIL